MGSGARALYDEAAAAAGRKVRVHFKVDTGLTRLGAPVAEAATAPEVDPRAAPVEVEGLFTHLATADEPDTANDQAQVARFADLLRTTGDVPRWVHVAASSGIAAFGKIPGCTAVRPGLSLYGLHTAPHLGKALALRPALAWRSRVQRLAEVPKGRRFVRSQSTGCRATVVSRPFRGLRRRASSARSAPGPAPPGGPALCRFAGRSLLDLVML